MISFQEDLYTGLMQKGYSQSFEVSKILVQAKTDFQDVLLFENPTFGKVLVLDGIVQTTEADEFCYHEMLTHPPILAHGDIRQVLIIGGGDGGILREVLRHKSVERATMVEIDGEVVRLCREHLPGLNGGAFDDPRAELIIGDGLDFVATTDRQFDLIIVDSTDPVGPGEVLFTDKFYGDCATRLGERGILVTQNGVPFFQPEELTSTMARLRPLFADVGAYGVAVPTYVGGWMTLAWASNHPGHRQLDLETLTRRHAQAAFNTRYYSPALHMGCFALPVFAHRLMAGSESDT